MAIVLRFPMFFRTVCVPIFMIIASSCQGLEWLPKKHAAFFIFGDSLYDAGNNNYIKTLPDFQSNYWPYGETSFGFPTGRTTDGRIIPDFICEYAKLPLIPPYLHPGAHDYTYGENFASAAAGSLVETNRGFVIDLKTQLGYFNKVEKVLRQKLGIVQAKKLLSRAVYLISIGSNDYFAPFFTNSSFIEFHSQDEYVGMVISNFTNAIQEIHKNGGSKFGFISMGPFGCIPMIKALFPETKTACVDKVTTLAKLHNKAFSTLLQELGRQLKDFKYSMLDYYTTTSERLEDPSKYGFKEGKIACCGTGPYRGLYSCGGKRLVTKEYELCDNPNDYLFFDALMWSGNSDVTGPYNLKALFEL
ncbi:hypothetical protein UlMin_012086 [Ulmus minor]